MNKIITCASYGGTGSSAITDLLLEFDNVKSIKEFEFTIVHEIDGINSLEYGLVDNWNRLNNDEYIYRFKKLVKRISKDYCKYFGTEFIDITDNYIDELIGLKWNGYWHQHKYRYTFIQRKILFEWSGSLKRRLSCLINREYEYVPSQKREEMYLARLNKEEFLDITRRYFERLMDKLVEQSNKEYIALDQLVDSNNIKKYMRYFNNIKIILVDRDPRDLYILNKKFWNEGWIPTDNIDTYIKWYKALRVNREVEIKNENILLIQFEDLIFDYEETLEIILKFLNIDKQNHIDKYKYFNPNISIKNTKLFEKFTDYNNDILKIEEELNEYCYFKK